MHLDIFKIFRGMLTPYVEPLKPERIEPTIKEPIQTDCEFLEFSERCIKKEMGRQTKLDDDFIKSETKSPESGGSRCWGGE